jgi:uncharacterized repeat protein (TIGR03803 family)
LLVSFCVAISEQTLFTFRNGNGQSPFAGLTLDASGNLYGTTCSGGVYERGTVFELAQINGGWKPYLLYSFKWDGKDGTCPYARITLDDKGNLYGTTIRGGVNDCGTVFQLTPSGGGRWIERVIYNFTGITDGAAPYGDLVIDQSGRLYGTTYSGGANTCITQGCGTVFELLPTKSGWKQKVIYTFAGGDDGFGPFAGPVFGSDGSLYGTTNRGGSETCSQSCGTVFQLKHINSRWKESVLHSFSGENDGGAPYSGVILDSHGNLYGTTSAGGTIGFGTAFELKHQRGVWTEVVLYSFGEGFAGDAPLGSLVLDSGHRLYGTTSAGGKTGAGAVFELSHSPSGWSTTVLYDFSFTDGDTSTAGLVLDNAGNLYGTTSQGGGSRECENGCGVAFELTP